MDFLLKKASIVTLGLAVAITPGISVAAEEGSENVSGQQSQMLSAVILF